MGHTDGRPLAERIAATIRAAVMASDLAPGSQLRSTQQLMADHKASNITIQRALKLLKDEGLLYSQHGKGVFVNDTPPLAIEPAAYAAPAGQGQPYPWMVEAELRQQRGGSRIVRVAEVTPPARVARVFELDEGGTVVLRERVMLLDDEPVELARSYYPLGLAKGTRLADRRKIPGGAPALLVELGAAPVDQVDELLLRSATTEEYEALELPGDVPVLETFRVVYASDRRPVEVSVLTKGAHRYKLRYRVSTQ